MNKYLLISVLSALAFPAHADVDSLINAAKGNDIAQIQNLLKAGDNINAKNSLGNTALHYAVAANNSDMVKFLLENGADTSVVNDKGWTPLAIAEKKNFGEITAMFQSQQSNKDLSALVEKASKDAEKITDKAVEVKDNAVAKVEEVKKVTEIKAKDTVKKAEEKIDTLKESVKKETAEKVNDVKNKTEEVTKSIETTVEPLVAVKEPEIKADSEKAEVKEKEEAKAETKAEPEKAEVKEEAKPAPKPAPRRVVNPVAAKPAPKLIPSSLNKEIFAGDEEIIYCLYYLGLQTDQHNLTLASEFFAGTTLINKARFDKIADLAHKYYDNASEAEMQNMANICSKIITPQNSDKQNQIIRAMNRAIGY